MKKRKRSKAKTWLRGAAITLCSAGLTLTLIIGAMILARPPAAGGNSFAAAAADLIHAGTAEDAASAGSTSAYADTGKNIIVDQNAGPQEIVSSIENHGYIRDPFVFRIAVAVMSLFHKIEAGGYYVTENMSDWDIFRSLANPSLRYVTVAAGMRKQEIADLVGDKLDWDTVEKRELVNVNIDLNQDDLEGKYFPGTYLFPEDANPQQVGEAMVANYDKEIAVLKKKYPNSKVNYDTALLIASIIQREAAGKQDMRLISGIIWNRIFDGMSLSMDATVQYARGKTDDGWWAPISASDIRTIDSPYNTYKNDGLPPTPISNVSADALDAALNPQKTSCLFYIHDNKHRIHCSATYAGQLQNIQTYLK